MDQKFTMTDKTQNNVINLEGVYYATKHLELQKQRNHIHQSYQFRVRGCGENSGSGGNRGRG